MALVLHSVYGAAAALRPCLGFPLRWDQRVRVDKVANSFTRCAASFATFWMSYAPALPHANVEFESEQSLAPQSRVSCSSTEVARCISIDWLAKHTEGPVTAPHNISTRVLAISTKTGVYLYSVAVHIMGEMMPRSL